jgi:hypothetical protein
MYITDPVLPPTTPLCGVLRRSSLAVAESRLRNIAKGRLPRKGAGAMKATHGASLTEGWRDRARGNKYTLIVSLSSQQRFV